MSLITYLSFLLIVASKQTSDDFKYYDILSKIKHKVREIENHETFFEEESKYSHPLIVIVYYSKKKCYRCEEREQVVEDMVDKYRHQVEFRKYNCDPEMEEEHPPGHTKIQECHKNYPDSLPSIHFKTPESEAFYPYDPISFKEAPFQPEFNKPHELSMMIESYMPVYARKINNMKDANDYIEKFGHLNKSLYLSTSDELPLYFKGLSVFFKDRLEFGFVSSDAHEVIEYFNITSRPKWLVVRIKNLVNMEKRSYSGTLGFNELKDYLSVFASKEKTNRAQDYGIGKTAIRDQTLKKGSKIQAAPFNFDDFRANFIYPDEVQIVHVTDTMSMNYPNLVIFQNFYG